MSKRAIITLSFVIAVMFLIRYSMWKKDDEYNKHRCQTKDLELRGVIDFVSGRASYRGVHIKGMTKGISLDVKDEIFRKGFNQYHFFDVGDSIIKSAGSKKVTVKNKDSIVVFNIDCND